MSVGLLVVRLQYGLYVGHWSKWFVNVLKFKFWSSVRWLQCRQTMAGNVWRLCEEADFGELNCQHSTKVDAM